MIELFNRLLQKHGSRLTLVAIGLAGLEFKVGTYGTYRFEQNAYGDLMAFQCIEGDWTRTANADWLLAIAQGKTRNDEGKVA